MRRVIGVITSGCHLIMLSVWRSLAAASTCTCTAFSVAQSNILGHSVHDVYGILVFVVFFAQLYSNEAMLKIPAIFYRHAIASRKHSVGGITDD